MSEVAEIEYLEEEYPEVEYGTDDGSLVVDERVSRALIGSVKALDFWSVDCGGVCDINEVNVIAQVDACRHVIFVDFSGVLTRDLHMIYPCEVQGGTVKTEISGFRSGGLLHLDAVLDDDKWRDCHHTSLEHLNEDRAKCKDCGWQLSVHKL